MILTLGKQKQNGLITEIYGLESIHFHVKARQPRPPTKACTSPNHGASGVARPVQMGGQAVGNAVFQVGKQLGTVQNLS